MIAKYVKYFWSFLYVPLNDFNSDIEEKNQKIWMIFNFVYIFTLYLSFNSSHKLLINDSYIVHDPLWPIIWIKFFSNQMIPQTIIACLSFSSALFVAIFPKNKCLRIYAFIGLLLN